MFICARYLSRKHSEAVLTSTRNRLKLLKRVFSRWMYVLSFTGGRNAGVGRINTPSPAAAMPEVGEKKTKLLVNRLED